MDLTPGATIDAQVAPGTDGGDAFDELVAMAAALSALPVVAICGVDGDRLRILAARGLDEAMRARLHAPRPMLPAVRPVQHGAPGTGEDAGTGFMLELPVTDAAGARIGMLVVADHQPREGLDAAAKDALARVARIAARLLERPHEAPAGPARAADAAGDTDAVLVFGADGAVRFANAAAEALFAGGVRPGADAAALFPPGLQVDADEAARWLRDGALSPSRGARTAYDLRVADAGGGPRTLEATRCAWLAGEPGGTGLVLRDIAMRRPRRERRRAPAQRDGLTGLPQRAALLADLDEMLAGGNAPLGVALLGLDRFRAINDTLGHAVGDAVLQLAASRLQAALPDGARLARFGGDEFALVFPHSVRAQVDAHIDAVLHALTRPCRVDTHLVHIEASVGVAMADPAVGGGELAARADLALQRAKRAGGHTRRHFEPGMRIEAHHRRLLDIELRRACEAGEFELHYQPQVCLTSGLPTGAEALLRWRHPKRGLLSPDKFIDALADSPVGPVVGRWILERACQDAASWPPVRGRRMMVGVNLFPVQLDAERLPGEVDEALARSGLLPAHLELELTETIALRDDGDTAGALANIRARGISVAYDDFGTGYASLSVLQRLPVDRVKIDRSFVRDVIANRGNAAIVRSILLIARNFDLRVIAEGVETPEQAQLLHELGCQEAQGFLYSPALPPAEFGHWLDARLRQATALRDMEVAGHA
ncbi:hypothetical protein GCM10028862_20360 [Luteimonas pelagia]